MSSGHFIREAQKNGCRNKNNSLPNMQRIETDRRTMYHLLRIEKSCEANVCDVFFISR